MRQMELNEKNLLDVYDLLFTSTHSNGFKIAEVKTLLFDNEYWFLERPKENWKVSLFEYLDNIGYDKSLLNLNVKL